MSDIDPLVPPNPDAPEPKKKAASKRPTTRAARAAKTAARKAAEGERPKATATPAVAPRKANLETRLARQIVTIGTGIAAAGAMTGRTPVKADGLLVVQQSADLAKALNDVAANDPRVARALEGMLAVSVYGALFGALAPLAVGIAANHELIPRETAAMLGIELPDVTPAPMAPPGSVDLT